MFRRLIERSTRPPALTLFALLQAGLAVWLVARNAWTLDGIVDARCEVMVGDYLAFHTGARLLATGEGARLYELDRQHDFQRSLTGCALERWQPYVNPPLLALALVPASALGPRVAFHLFGLAVALGLALALTSLVRVLPVLGATPEARLTAALLAFGFAPVAATLAGGQNTALSLALGAGFYASLARGRDVRAGVLLGLLSYKPMLLPALVVVLAVDRRWRVLSAAGAVALAHYLLGAVLAGPDWPLRLLATGAHYRSLEWAANLPTHVSLVPFFERLVSGPAGSFLGYAGALFVLCLTAVVARRGSASQAATWAVAFAAALLASPHLQYYDVGLAVLPALLGLEARAAPGRALPASGRLLLVAAYLGYPAYRWSTALGFQPWTLVLVALFAWLWRGAASTPVEAGAARA